VTTVPATTSVPSLSQPSRAETTLAPLTETSGAMPHTRSRRAPRPAVRDHVTARNFDHESLWALVCRRLSFATYRRTARYHRQLVIAPQRGMADHVLPVPLLADTIAVYLSSHLPMWLVARLGHGGLCRAARWIESSGKALARLIKLILSPLLACLRWVRSVRAERSAVAHRRAQEQRFIATEPDGQRLHVLLDGRVRVESAAFTPSALYLCLRTIRPVTEPIQIFAHVYPEDSNLLPESRRAHGFFCKDHNPLIEPQRWPTRQWYRDETWLGDLPPGYYRIEIGIIDRQTLRKFAVSGSARSSIDLGWVRLGSPAENL
jgi:hypothetical protein